MSDFAPVDVGPHAGDSPSPYGRPTLGPGYDWFIELLRQLGRPALFLMCMLAMLDYFCFAQWWRGGESSVSEFALCVVAGLAGAMCGLRGLELGQLKLPGGR